MRTITTFAAALISGIVLVCGNLAADTVTIVDLPEGDTDTLSIQLDPVNGALIGAAGGTVGWGFTVDWTSTDGDWISFIGSSLGSVAQAETNPDLNAVYADFIGPQGGPVDFGLSPGTWTESFDDISQGAGAYQIVSDPSIAEPGAQDTGQITFDFVIYNGDPLTAGQIGDDVYSYYGSSTDFSVTVASSTPEPATFGLLLAGAGILAAANWRRILPPVRAG
jgi:hypothetical protein